MSFILAALVALCTLLWATMKFYAGMMSESRSASTGALPVLGVGLGIAGLIAATHWLHW